MPREPATAAVKGLVGWQPGHRDPSRRTARNGPKSSVTSDGPEKGLQGYLRQDDLRKAEWPREPAMGAVKGLVGWQPGHPDPSRRTARNGPKSSVTSDGRKGAFRDTSGRVTCARLSGPGNPPRPRSKAWSAGNPGIGIRPGEPRETAQKAALLVTGRKRAFRDTSGRVTYAGLSAPGTRHGRGQRPGRPATRASFPGEPSAHH